MRLTLIVFGVGVVLAGLGWGIRVWTIRRDETPRFAVQPWHEIASDRLDRLRAVERRRWDEAEELRARR